MTAQPAEEMWSRTTASTSSSDGFTVTNRFVKAYSVVCDPTDDQDVALTAPNIPLRGDLLPGTSQMRVTDKQADRISPIFWITTVTWTGESGPSGVDDAPWNQPPVQSWDNVISQEVIDEDRHGKPIVNAVGTPIEGITIPVVDWILRIEKNYRTINLPALHIYLHSVNSDIIPTSLGPFGPGLAKLQRFRPEPQFNDSGVVTFWKVNAEIGFRYPWRTEARKSWWPRRLNEGYKFRTVDGRVINALDDNQANVSRPILLRPDGRPANNPNESQPVEVDAFIPLPYRALGLL